MDIHQWSLLAIVIAPFCLFALCMFFGSPNSWWNELQIDREVRRIQRRRARNIRARIRARRGR